MLLDVKVGYCLDLRSWFRGNKDCLGGCIVFEVDNYQCLIGCFFVSPSSDLSMCTVLYVFCYVMSFVLYFCYCVFSRSSFHVASS